MGNNKVFEIVFAGGSCGITMVRVGETLAELCKEQGLQVKIQYLDLWVSDYVMPSTDLVVEMFPYYKDLDIPLLNGRPLLNPTEEKRMYGVLIEKIKQLSH